MGIFPWLTEKSNYILIFFICTIYKIINFVLRNYTFNHRNILGVTYNCFTIDIRGQIGHNLVTKIDFSIVTTKIDCIFLVSNS